MILLVTRNLCLTNSNSYVIENEMITQTVFNMTEDFSLKALVLGAIGLSASAES